ncbi:unnamed protein product [Orchesella dallaii]|uniref:Uncharacterized protein n=1 Tax=Orchesella dallaii TaxID=48710 RepID=A0ABP1RNS0_9HEXA
MDTETPDKKVHTGKPENFRLTRHFLDDVSLRDGEEPLDLKLRDISKEEQDEIDSLSTASERTVRSRAAVLAEVTTLGGQKSQQVEEFDSPLPGSSCSMNEREDCRRTCNQARISAQERVIQDRKSFGGNGGRFEFEECAPVGTKGELRFTFFDDDFMGYARVKRVREEGPITLVAETITRSVLRLANDATMTLANLVKIGEQFFGQRRAQIDFFKVNTITTKGTVSTWSEGNQSYYF